MVIELNGASLPFSLSLHRVVQAAAGEAGVLNFWLENRASSPITAYRIELNPRRFAEAPAPAGMKPTFVGEGEAVLCAEVFKPGAEGVHPVDLSIEVSYGGQTFDALMPMSLLVTVQSRNQGGNVFLELPAGALVGDINTGGGNFVSVGDEGSMTNIRTQGGSVRIKMTKGGHIEGIDTSVASVASRADQQDRPGDDELLPLRLRPAPPEWMQRSTPSLLAFAEGWSKLGRKGLTEFSFIDVRERACKTARVGEPYILRLRSGMAGHITLLTQSFDANLYQLLPHQHCGTQLAAAGQLRYLPSKPSASGHIEEASGLLVNWSSAADGGSSEALGFDGLELTDPGQELALAIISPEPISEPMAWFDGAGNRAKPVSPQHWIQTMNRAWAMPACEVSLAVLNVYG